MTISSTINYDNPANFTFDNTKIEVTGSGAKLLPMQPLPGLIFSQDFSSSSGFTFDGSLTEITAGTLSQIDQRDANATAFADYSTGINLNWGDGTLTATPTGSPTITGGKLDLTAGAGTFVDYSAVGNADFTQLGAVRFKYTANYTGSPANIQSILLIGIASSVVNRLYLRHDTAGNLFARTEDSTGSLIFNTNLGAFSPTAGVEVEFEINYDLNTGATRFFIDGTQLGVTIAATGTRTSTSTLIRLGADQAGNVNNPDFLINDLIIFDAVQHTANYTPVAYGNPTIYDADVIIMPDFVYAGLGNIQGFTDFTTTENGNPRFTLNGMWWDGGNVVASNGTYAEANDKTTLDTNIGAFSAADTVTLNIMTPSSNVQVTLSQLDLTYTGSEFWTDNPTITMNGAIGMEELTTFSESVLAVGNDTVQYVIVINTIPKFWNGAAWVTSTNLFSESNDAATVNANAAALDLSAGVQMQVRAFLHSDDGTTTPTLEDVTFEYEFNVPFSIPNKCLVFGFVTNLACEAVEGAKVRVFTTGNTLLPDGSIIAPKEAIVKTDDTGYFQIPVIETASKGDPPPLTVNFAITFLENGFSETTQLDNRIIPNLPSCNINDLLVAT